MTSADILAAFDFLLVDDERSAKAERHLQDCEVDMLNNDAAILKLITHVDSEHAKQRESALLLLARYKT